VQSDKVPLCPVCNSVARPDVVFFGESLPKRFLEMRTFDFKECDLLIVAGTSLLVYPFAGLANEVSPLTPRLLLNRDSVGAFRAIPSATGGEGEKEAKVNVQESVGNYRDVQVLGDCDQGVLQLCRELGWEEDLMKLAASC